MGRRGAEAGGRRAIEFAWRRGEVSNSAPTGVQSSARSCKSSRGKSERTGTAPSRGRFLCEGQLTPVPSCRPRRLALARTAGSALPPISKHTPIPQPDWFAPRHFLCLSPCFSTAKSWLQQGKASASVRLTAGVSKSAGCMGNGNRRKGGGRMSMHGRARKKRVWYASGGDCGRRGSGTRRV